jgi:hypothetical protein
MQFPKKRPKVEQLTVDEYRKLVASNPLMIPKKGKLREPPKSKSMKAICPESELQKAANKFIELKKWDYIRFPDWFLRWMKLNTPDHVSKEFFKHVGGKMPDNFILIPLGKGMFFGVKLELKTEDVKGNAVGKLHGRQKKYAIKEEWMIARNTKQIEEVLSVIEKKLQIVKQGLLNEIQS